jgi:fimbrial chaperone protein
LKYVLTSVFLSGFFLLSGLSSYAGSMRVIPTKIFLGGGKKADVLKVTNAGEEKMTLQVEVSKWFQDEGGADSYEATEDIVFYPKIFTLEKGRQQILRVGAKNLKPETNEATYRVFIQEIPVSKPGETGLTMALRLSIPIFIKPVKEIKDWVIEKAEISTKGAILIKIKTTGNSHISVRKITAMGIDGAGKDVFHRDEPGWYVLQGMSYTFGMKVSGKECRNSSVIKITAEAEGLSKEIKLPVDEVSCPEEGKGPAELDERRTP